MVITNRRIIIPKQLEFDDAKILIVEEFKLLGVIIDNKLNFIKHVAKQCITINRMLFSIKRLFYLPFDCKLQFFKSFILPYFDYSMSLSIYFHKTAIQKLCKSYYFCLFKLFKYKFFDKSHSLINSFLQKDNLFSFHHRLTSRLLTFIHKISFSPNSPFQLKEWLKPITVLNTSYNLRSNNKTVFVPKRTSTKFGDMTFFNFFCKYLNNINFLSFSKTFTVFLTQMNNSLDIYLFNLIDLIPKFNCNLDFYFYLV
jgi:hypothetical protein